MLTLFILSYTLGAVATYGALFSFWQLEYSSDWKRYNGYENDRIKAVISGVAWPVFAISALTVWGRKPFQSGLKFY